MKRLAALRRTLILLAVLLPVLALLGYVALRSGPLAPVDVTLARVESRAITPKLFGIGTVESRYSYRVGPTLAGRVMRVEVDVGDLVEKGQVLAEMEPVDFDDRLRAQEAALRRAQAQLREAEARNAHAQSQAERYARLLAVRSTSDEIVAAKQQEFQAAQAMQTAAREDVARLDSERRALLTQRANLRLVAPAAGLVTARAAEPGATVLAGQSVLELIDPTALWVHVRFDQVRAHGLAEGLAAHVVLRSQQERGQPAHVLRVEPMADAVTEEILAKVVFDAQPSPLPPVGELAEVTADLPPLAPAPVVPNAALQRIDGQLGVWKVDDNALTFVPVTTGAADLDGAVQVQTGLKTGDSVVVYSAKALHARSRIKVRDALPGARS